MPELVPITNNFFVNLITRLGLKPPPALGWVMQTQVVPVSIVDTDVPLTAIATTQVINTPFSQGVQAAPAALTLLADTGPQNAGNFSLLIWVGVSSIVTGPADFIVERRNAANNANIWRQVSTISNGGSGPFVQGITLTLAQGERVRIETSTVSVATVEANIWLTAL